MFDEEAKKQVRARSGDEIPEAEFKLLSVGIERIRDAAGNIEVVAKATILDQRSGEEVVLKHGERRYDSGFTVIIRSEQDSSYAKELTEAPAEFEGPAGQYRLLEINLEDSAVTVEKLAVEDGEPEKRILQVRSAAPTPSPQITNPKSTPDEAQINVFDLF